jgi:D-mannonate dehydratase
MSKLTLNVDAKVAAQAKRYAAHHDTSVSQMVERYLDLVGAPASSEEDDPPVLRMLLGAAKGISQDEYGRHLRRKYR